MRMRYPSISRTSTNYVTLEQGFRDFIKDLSKLQQFIEINATAFSKILKKWDKTSKSQTKELYLSRAVEVQPCFNHDVISELSDQAATSLLDCSAWAEGDGTTYSSEQPDGQIAQTPRLEQDETDSDLLEAMNRGDVNTLRGLISHVAATPLASDRLTKAFLAGVSLAPVDCLQMLLATKLIDLKSKDEINDRNCLHKTAMTGRLDLLQVALDAGVDAGHVDAYGRIPLHYACMNGHVQLIEPLVQAKPDSPDVQDLDNFTPLIHSIVHAQLQCAEKILSYHVRINPQSDTDHSPLNLACQYGSVPIVELLLRGRPDIMPDAEGLYPQHLVARFGRDPKLLLMLRDYGADLDQQDKLYNWTPLFHAASEGRDECLKTLLDCGVNVNAKDEKELSALYYATWEGHMRCMATLAAVVGQKATLPSRKTLTSGMIPQESTPATGADIEIIPDLSLPPPIIPTRRYGHNFLESKTTVVIGFEDAAGERPAVQFYDESKYPAARLTIAPRSSDILPRNLLLPINEDTRYVSFEMKNLDSFAVDFDVYPTFGKKVIAKGSVPAEVFRGVQSSSGHHHLSLLDPRLRSVGQLHFRFQVIKPFSGTPLDITPFATYWKATSQLESRPSSLVTGSSLSGEHIRLTVQLTQDGVPIVHPQWIVNHSGIEFPILSLTYAQFSSLGDQLMGKDRKEHLQKILATQDLTQVHKEVGSSYLSLAEVLSMLPIQRHINIHILYPTEAEEQRLRLGSTSNLNDVVDGLLHVVFHHARQSREHASNSMRSIVFTSYNKDLCTALNWKQPNCESSSAAFEACNLLTIRAQIPFCSATI